MIPAYERQWVLEHPGVSFAWGGVNPANPFRLPRGVYNLEPPEQAATTVTTEDAEHVRRDGMRFGQDYRAGRTWTFTLGVKGTSPANARQLLADAELAWRGDGVRMIPGAMASLTTMVGGQLRTVYGRPRLFTPSYAKLAASEASAVATFDTFDDCFYGPEQQLRIDMTASPASGGAIFPAVFPLVFATSGANAGGLTVGGTLPAFVAAEVHGPIGNPRVYSPTAGWALKLASSLVAGQVVTLDARPWSRRIVTPDGASLAGKLDRLGPLSAASLKPGPHEVGLQGTDPTGTAYVMLRWQTAHASMI